MATKIESWLRDKQVAWNKDVVDGSGVNEQLSNDTCETCGGDGKETCTNPDHGFYSMIYSVNCDISRIGCPCCGHDPEHKVPNGGKCEDCNGTGKILAN